MGILDLIKPFGGIIYKPLQNGVEISIASLRGEEKIFVNYEDITNEITYYHRKENGWLTAASLIMVILINFIATSFYERIFYWELYLLFACFTTILFIIYLSKFESIIYVMTNNGKYIPIFRSKISIKNGIRACVKDNDIRECVNDFFGKRNEYLRNKYFVIDKEESLENQLSKIDWLLDLYVIDVNEYEKLKKELNIDKDIYKMSEFKEEKKRTPQEFSYVNAREIIIKDILNLLILFYPLFLFAIESNADGIVMENPYLWVAIGVVLIIARVNNSISKKVPAIDSHIAFYEERIIEAQTPEFASGIIAKKIEALFIKGNLNSTLSLIRTIESHYLSADINFLLLNIKFMAYAFANRFYQAIELYQNQMVDIDITKLPINRANLHKVSKAVYLYITNDYSECKDVIQSIPKNYHEFYMNIATCLFAKILVSENNMKGCEIIEILKIKSANSLIDVISQQKSEK